MLLHAFVLKLYQFSQNLIIHYETTRLQLKNLHSIILNAFLTLLTNYFEKLCEKIYYEIIKCKSKV